jgi:hypothetical protein
MYPHERSLVKRLDGKRFALLGVNSDKDLTAIRQTIVEEEITWPNWWDDGRVNGPIHTNWQVAQRPSIYLLDAKGVIRHKNIQPDALDAAIDQLLAELDSTGTP